MTLNIEQSGLSLKERLRYGPFTPLRIETDRDRSFPTAYLWTQCGWDGPGTGSMSRIVHKSLCAAVRWFWRGKTLLFDRTDRRASFEDAG